MRPEVRADYERAVERVAGDAAFAVRLERWFGELRVPLVAVYGNDARFPAAWTALLDAIAATAGGRPHPLRASGARPPRRAARARPRARDHARLAAPRAGGRLRHLRRPLRRD